MQHSEGRSPADAPSESHSSARERFVSGWFLGGLAVLVLAVECGVVKLLFEGALSQGFLLHVVLALALAGWIYYDSAARHDRFALLLLLLVPLTGPFGAFACLLTFLLYTVQARTAVSPAVWIEEFLAEDDIGMDAGYRARMQSLHNSAIAGGVEPFQDILQHGSVRQKQMAIARITRHFRPSFGAMLVAATRDSNAAVRVQAATAMAAIERRFMSRYIALEKAVEEASDESARLQLAALYDDYAHADILDAHSCARLQAKAIALYEAHSGYKNNPDLLVPLARLYLRQGNPEQTCALLHPLVADNAAPSPVALSWYMEALFCLRRYAEVRELARRHEPERHRSGKDRRSKKSDTRIPGFSTAPMLFLEEQYYDAA